ncbi:unnamed protein product [Rotaria magnacalcarata]|uniref:N-acetylgalactosaminide beta-1,3-galactosyltransferase n=1 Tax=Rotaria magnacalcarata TaxID=392030 RepID=A0A819P908_9BILA|nr:unnamed protein product [Rotaria magnacalcarata]CAF2150240.1 unnamed protein product [Rotaria magnacalcarata]CAF4012755.1 unnamed protein product [Rotaria magnacalcarata]CAF4069036.1 unnamed protein product [Rotaria magnacalcarata]
MTSLKQVQSKSRKQCSVIFCFCAFIFVPLLIGSIIYQSRGIKIPTIFSSINATFSFGNVTNSPTKIIATIPHIPSESFICDKRNIRRFPVSSTTPTNDSFDVYRKSSLEKYCDIVPIPRYNWSSPKSYTENDIAFIIFTAAAFFHTRTTAARDTWVSRITNYYFLSATPYPYLPITVVPGAGEDKLSNMKKLFYGLQIIYKQQMNLSPDKQQKWFYIAGCDTFILPHHLLKRLHGLDYRQPIRIGGHWGQYICPGPNGTKFEVEFPSGGAGFFFSKKLLEILQPHLTNYVENVWPHNSEISDVALSCLSHQLGVPLTKQVGFWAHSPAFTLNENGRAKFLKEPEPNDFHYIKPDEMYALDEFYIYQHMDRLINDQNWIEFTQFMRHFVASHYELLRKKRRECTLPTIEAEVKLNKMINKIA